MQDDAEVLDNDRHGPAAGARLVVDVVVAVVDDATRAAERSVVPLQRHGRRRQRSRSQPAWRRTDRRRLADALCGHAQRPLLLEVAPTGVTKRYKGIYTTPKLPLCRIVNCWTKQLMHNKCQCACKRATVHFITWFCYTCITTFLPVGR